MTYQAYPAAPARRPATVSAAGVLLFVAGGALLVMAASQFLIVGPVSRAVDEVADEPGTGAAAGLVFAVAGVFNALFAVGLILLASFDVAGKQPARIMSWIVAPLALVCCGCGSAAYSGPIFDTAGTDASFTGDELTEREFAAIGAGMPGWYTPTVLSAIAMLALVVIAALILLGVPSSNDYFRPKPQTWIPGSWPPPPHGTYPPGTPYAPGAPGTYPPGTNPPGGSPQGWPPPS